MCKNVSIPLYPLISYENSDFFKVYVHDIGLLVAMYGFEMKNQLLTKKLKGPVKGGIYENLIASMLIRNGKRRNYYKKSESSTEIEFLIDKNAEIIPIEVKASNNQTKSLNNYIEEYKPKVAYKLVDGNVGTDGIKNTIPHYMAMFI